MVLVESVSKRRKCSPGAHIMRTDGFIPGRCVLIGKTVPVRDNSSKSKHSERCA